MAVEATGNTFNAIEPLHGCGVKTVVLETQRPGQIRTAYCTNDRTDAVKLAFGDLVRASASSTAEDDPEPSNMHQQSARLSRIVEAAAQESIAR